MKYELGELSGVLAVARHRNFRAAAAELSISRSALSHAVAALEERLGVRLFHRTTRSVTLTDAGTRLVAEVSPALATIRHAVESVADLRTTPTGTLRLNMAPGAAVQLATLLTEFARLYPAVHVEIVTDNALIDIVRDGFDAGVRLAEAVPPGMAAVPLGPEQRMVVVGRAELVARGPVIRVPMDLLHHSCIRYRLANGRVWDWEFAHDGQAIVVPVQGPLTLDDASVTLHLVRAGAAFAYLSRWMVEGDLAAGHLLQVLEAWTPAYPGLCLYYPKRRPLLAGMRAFVELAQGLRREHQGEGRGVVPTRMVATQRLPAAER